MYRIFLAHAKAMSELAVDAACSAVWEVLSAKNTDLDIVVISARADHAARALSCGGWDPWCKSISDVLDPISREPRFHAVVVPRGPFDDPCGDCVSVGRATAAICKYAVAAGRPVYVFDVSERVVLPAKGAETVDAEDWLLGWRILV
jgi:hypothetical protein